MMSELKLRRFIGHRYMHMKNRMILFIIAFFSGVPIALIFGGEDHAISIMFGWFIFFARNSILYF